MLKLNLQFFAEGEVDADVTTSSEYGVEESGAAEPTVTEESSADATDNAEADAQGEQTQGIDINAIAAAARRKAEQQAQSQIDAMNAEFARRYAGYTNPITGQPIRSQADYFAAMDAQEELEARKEIESKGINYDIITNLINNNPKIRQAEQLMAEAKRQQTINQINSDVAELGKIDPSIKSLENVPPDVIQLSMESNISLINAYKIVNFGKVSQSQQAAITQSAINQVKGKAHMTPVNGVATPDEGVDIPTDVLGKWQEMFPEKSAKELRELYNKSL